MADHFSDRYWATQYWTVRYFQAGELVEGAISASLSGAGSLTATLSYQSVLENIVARGRKRKRRLEESQVELDDDIVMARIIEHLSRAA
jgi:homoserine kinase